MLQKNSKEFLYKLYPDSENVNNTIIIIKKLMLIQYYYPSTELIKMSPSGPLMFIFRSRMQPSTTHYI